MDLLLNAVKAAQPAAEGAAPHLVDHIEQQTSASYNLIKEAAANDFSKTLERIKWPSKNLQLDDRLTSVWIRQINTLLDLQEPGLKARASLQEDQSKITPVILLPLEVMVHPLQLRFRYHFYGNRPTNRLDKPEYFLSHVLDILDDYSNFLLDHLQPVMDERSLTRGNLDDALYPDVISAFISALLPMVSDKILKLLPEISQQPQLLSHFMHELMSFDTTLRDSWGYIPTPNSPVDWKGLTWSVLVTYDYFNAWLTVEKDFALARYEAIISTPDGRDIDFESLEPGTTKPTKSTLRVNDLLETVTDRYRPLSSFSQKLRFLIDIQLEIFDLYHQRLHGSLERYIMDTSTLGKVIQGSGGTSHQGPNPDQDIHGRYGLESLCKVFGSAEYLERKMGDWGEDIFFLELWDELQDRARRNQGTNSSVGRDLEMQEVASRTSTTIMQKIDVDGADDVESGAGGALFDETASAYRRLRLKAEEQIHSLLHNAITSSLRPYARTSGWATLSGSEGSVSTVLSPSAALDTPLALLSDYLSFLASVLAPAPLRRIVRHLCAGIQRYVWDNVLTRHSFSGAGAAQLRANMGTLKRVVDSALGRGMQGEAARGMARLDAGIRLLGLPIRAGKGNERLEREDSGHSDADDEQWDWDGQENTTSRREGDPGASEDDSPSPESERASSEPRAEPHVWSLWEVERRVFRSNESARQVLAEMELWGLNEADARKVLERRVEVGS